MHQVAKTYICGAYVEIREGGETSSRAGAFRRSKKEPGNAGERHDNHGAVNRVLQWIYLAKDRGYLAFHVANARRGGRATSQNGSPRKAEDSNHPRAGSKLIADQHATARTVNLALTSQRVRSPCSQRSMPPPFGKLRDEICAITRCFFVLSALVETLA